MLYNIHKIWTNMLQIECGAVVDTLLCLEDMVLYRVCSQACSLLEVPLNLGIELTHTNHNHTAVI